MDEVSKIKSASLELHIYGHKFVFDVDPTIFPESRNGWATIRHKFTQEQLDEIKSKLSPTEWKNLTKEQDESNTK